MSSPVALAASFCRHSGWGLKFFLTTLVDGAILLIPGKSRAGDSICCWSGSMGSGPRWEIFAKKKKKLSAELSL